jgi:RNA polymerase sigma factor (sigma-70 family)
MDDWALLRQYAANRSETAFARLADRYIKFVYGACVRDLHNECLAEDATQVVFLILARKAASIRKGVTLSSWLFTTSRFVCRSIMRQEARRAQHEWKAVQDRAWDYSDYEDRDRLFGVLDEALEALDDLNRKAVVLRFIDGLSVSETAAAIGITTDAAQIRLRRAVQKMRVAISHQAA